MEYMNRRNLLLSAIAAAVAAGRTPRILAQDRPGSKALGTLFDEFVKENLDADPEEVSSLGLDTGARAGQKSQLDDYSLTGIVAHKALTAGQLSRLRAIDRSQLSAADTIGYDVVMFSLSTQDGANQAFSYGNGSAGEPYVVSQFSGSYHDLPSFLDSRHTIVNPADCDAYLARLSAFGTVLDQEIEVARHDLSQGVVPPDFILATTLQQLQSLRAPLPEMSPLTESLVRRAREKNLPGDYGRLAGQRVRAQVYPALERQIALVRDMQKIATHDAGVWKLPRGGDYYAASLLKWGTTRRDPADLHRSGLELVKQHVAQIDRILRQQGLIQGSVGERTRAMYEDPKYLYPNTDAGREALLADLNRRVQSVWGKLPTYFSELPKAKVEIHRAPKERESGSAIGYYTAGSLDGQRPGIYWINLRDTGEDPKWFVPTITYHESIPGHHLQLSIQRELDLPLIRKMISFSAYSEGWAIYAEQLAAEMGEYDSDPLGHIGQLHGSLQRAVRVVVDTGLHSQKWTREQAIQYYAEVLGEPAANARTEVDRYCVWPGQGCAYMLGKLKFLEIRARAQKKLGAKYDIRKFHDAMLRPGAVPLDIMDKLYV
jgi:uncharacterized protein (DUF885 family)